MYRTSFFIISRFSLQRGFATTASIKPNIKLLAKLRQETEVSMTKAKEALIKNDNDYQLALNWLNQDALASGAKKAAKVADRVAGEGLIGTASVNLRSTIIEVMTL
jgi:elongation factor Ts